ncbi:MAG: AMP-binding protein [Flavobacteriaceae bacterium]
MSEILSYAKHLQPNTHTFLEQWFDTNDYVEVKTSGSTGVPKTIHLQKEHMKNSAKATGAFFELEEGTKALLCLSTDYIAGKMMLVRALTLGWYLDVVEPVSNPLEGIDAVYDFCAMVPMQLANSLDNLTKVKILIVGGGAVSATLQEKIKNISTSVYATYGMTETITHIALKKLNNYNVVENYKVLPHVKISLDNRGCLVIDAPKVSDEKIITNDLVKIISETEFEWLGRYDHVINSGGVKLIPEQIEQKLSEIINDRFFVAGISDDVLGEKLVLVIEQNVTSSAVEKSAILNVVRNLKTLTKYEVPKEIYFLPKFIETETKKIQRRKTLDLLFKN